jgi:hypothetical protein
LDGLHVLTEVLDYLKQLPGVLFEVKQLGLEGLDLGTVENTHGCGSNSKRQGDGTQDFSFWMNKNHLSRASGVSGLETSLAVAIVEAEYPNLDKS